MELAEVCARALAETTVRLARECASAGAARLEVVAYVNELSASFGENDRGDGFIRHVATHSGKPGNTVAFAIEWRAGKLEGRDAERATREERMIQTKAAAFAAWRALSASSPLEGSGATAGASTPSSPTCGATARASALPSLIQKLSRLKDSAPRPG